jgi:hypothetical protein
MLELDSPPGEANYPGADMEAGKITPTLDALLAGQPAGTWVVLDPDLSRILSAAKTAEEAIRLAAQIRPPALGEATGERPVMIQVPDLSAGCFF